MEEKVNHPAHYRTLPAKCDKCGDTIECIEVVRHQNFNLGNVIKYVWRAGYKDKDATIEDLEKAQWYLEDEIKRLKNELEVNYYGEALLRKKLEKQEITTEEFQDKIKRILRDES